MTEEEPPTAAASGREFYPDALIDRDWWVNWVLAARWDQIGDDGEPEAGAVVTKQPVAPYQNGDARPTKWGADMPADEYPATAFEDVQSWNGKSVGLDVEAPDRVQSDELGIGILKEPARSTDGQPVTLLDWDDVRDPETEEIHPVCAGALEAVDAYAELSQSGEGVHQFVFGEVPNARQFLRHIDDEPFVGDDLPMVEMYSGKRLTAMTGEHIEGSGDDLVDGQELIDKLCWEFGRGTNNAEGSVSDPFAGQRDGADGEETGSARDAYDAVRPTHEEVVEAMESHGEYEGEHPDEWDTGLLGEVKYKALLRGRVKSDELSAVANWELYGLTAAAGYAIGKEPAEVVADIVAAGEEADGDGCDEQRVRREVSREYTKAKNDAAPAPSLQTLKEKSLLPVDYTHADELHSDALAPPVEKWSEWSEARANGKLGEESRIPEAALRYIAEEKDFYDFDDVDDDVGLGGLSSPELPAKAHNKALWWVNSKWAEEALDVDEDSDEKATVRRYKPRDAVVYNWQDVRYIYEDSKDEGRKAARELLSSRYDLMTVEETDELKMYEPETGVFTEETGELRTEIYDGLGSNWSSHELHEIQTGLRQRNIVPKPDLNGADLEGPHICVENGVLSLLDRELKPHSPEYHFVDRVPVEYNAAADTAPYEQFVGDLVEREEDAKALFEMVGHAITPDANERWKKFLILTGDADNGKSAFYGRVKSLLDGPQNQEENTSAVKLAKMAQNRFSIHSMYGSMANIAGEIDGKKIRNTAAIKDIPGGDVVELEPKGGESFFDTVNTTLMFAANDPPIIGERDKEAIATRIVPVELPFTFVDEPSGPNEKEAMDESDLEEWLDAPEALSGLLNLALDGIERLENNGGDVSLPEPPEERLRMYERTADPMREFGERCLKNQAGDYLVKADATTVYKEFATSEGYELGSNVGSVLHDVLRGVPGLNYTESRKRQPDYSGTELRLRGWDERKNVVDRVTLTEEGFEYAKKAGIVVDEDEDEDEDVEEGPSGAVPVRHAAQSPTGYTTVTVEVLSVEQPDGKLAMKATVKDNSSAIDVKSWDAPDALSEGDTVLLKNAEVGEYDGSSELTIQEGVTEVVDIQAGAGFTQGTEPAADQSQIEAKTSATDGGEPDEDADSDDERVMNKDIRDRIVQETTRRIGGNGASRADLLDAVSSALGVSEDRVDREIGEACREGRIYEPMEDRFKV